MGDEEASCLFASLFMQHLPAWMRILLEADNDDGESRPPARSVGAQADGHCRGGGEYGEPVGGKPCPDGLLRGLDDANRRGGQIGGQRCNKRHGVDAEQVMSLSDAAAAAVEICYYQWKFGDEAYSC
jgi:hypothetical protein